MRRALTHFERNCHKPVMPFPTFRQHSPDGPAVSHSHLLNIGKCVATPGYPLALSLAVSMAVLGALPDGRARAIRRCSTARPRGELSGYGGARRVEQDSPGLKQSLSKKKAKNVILLIGDGMGDSEITVARNFARGAGGYFKGIDALPLTGQYTHYSLHKDSGLPDYVTDSAASATAWTTGVVVQRRNRRGYPRTATPQPAGAGWLNGKATGNVSTAELQDATPAALLASPLASATAPKPPASSARAMPWKTAAPARSPSNG